MGIGTPKDFLSGVENGVDIFDCVMPTRVGRHGKIYASEGSFNITSARFKQDSEPLDPACNCAVCQRYTRRYIHHLFRAKEFLAPRLASYHNLSFFHHFMQNMRASIFKGEFIRFRDESLAKFSDDT
jgi:queuine tRNA-ribosyltransferase